MDIIRDKMVGEWKLNSSENFDEFLTEMGVNVVKRKAAAAFSPVLKMSIDGDTIKVTISTPLKDESSQFKLDGEFEHETQGEKMKIKVTCENGRIREDATPVSTDTKRKPVVIYREVVGDKLIQTMQITSGTKLVECKRIFKKLT